MSLNFEHFDPQFEFGTVDKQTGEPVRPRKKPGRKPNPPTPAQRKAQNRAAQRAFRERKRREMHEAEMTVKRCLYMRDQAVQEAEGLRTKVDELTYEVNYLRGMVLSYKLACHANRVDVPKCCELRDAASNINSSSIPSSLEVFLNNQRRIIDATIPSSTHDHLDSDKKDDGNESLQKNQEDDLYTALIDDSKTDSSSISDTPSESQSEGSLLKSDTQEEVMEENQQQERDADGMLVDVAAIAPQLANHLESPFIQQLMTADLVQPGMQQQQQSSLLAEVKHSLATTSNNALTGYHHNNNPSASTSGRFKTSDDTALFPPTELQRTVAHDNRIDLIPGAALRDHMIIFQDFYDADDLFTTLVEQAVFTGSELGDPDCWTVPRSFVLKYWFLLPNHRPAKRTDDIVDIVVDSCQRMLKHFVDHRIPMYMHHRDQYPDQFPFDTTCSTASLKPSFHYNHQHHEQQQHEQQPVTLSTSSLPINVLELISPNTNVFATAAGIMTNACQ
ncbi:hypothetical protein K492DRAFT_232854 [Lichtheimia hyalospora FSU 10163]|nr:hypothetical protein K492DRAFT_232854 [Lichtheimia hyalospora FSU 10163]